MRAKICGITRLEDALLAVQYGAFAIGFNFYNQSKRYISYHYAKEIIKNLPENIIKIGIFINISTEEILKHLEIIGLDYAQIYQPDLENTQYNHKFILALNITSETELGLLNHKILSSYYSLMLDAPLSSDLLLGGTGRLANWDLAKKLAQNYRLILAGGLTPDNIQQSIYCVNPFAVDVASGIEYSPGIKSPILLKQFLTGAQSHAISNT